ncbi:MAG: redoxin domain-containing protein [Ignavibacteria bacterium]|nr:redoxin domain-containing protein [Ignavibacteria bacterium]
MINFEKGNIRAPGLFGDFWLNSQPVTLRELKGSVVLIEFWDYSNVNCLRTQHYIKGWFTRYTEFDLTVIGVHTPQFKFGRDPENVENAIRRFGIEYPVVMDNDAIIWTAFSNRIWPTRYLIDKDGFLRFSHPGEGSYDQFERAIQALLAEAGYHGVFPDLLLPVRDTDFPGAVCYRSTAEIQLGYLKGTLGNPEGHGPESTVLYDDQGFHLNGRIYLRGKWYSERESVRFDGDSGEEGGASCTYEAIEVNLVMDSESDSPGKVFALQDRRPLTKENAGLDIKFDNEGLSYVLVDGPRDFNIVCNREFGEHEIALTTHTPGLEIFIFSFVTGAIPELVSLN